MLLNIKIPRDLTVPRNLTNSQEMINPDENYIVPDDSAMEIENLYEKSLPNDGVVIVKRDKKSPWSDKRLIDKK